MKFHLTSLGFCIKGLLCLIWGGLASHALAQNAVTFNWGLTKSALGGTGGTYDTGTVAANFDGWLWTYSSPQRKATWTITNQFRNRKQEISSAIPRWHFYRWNRHAKSGRGSLSTQSLVVGYWRNQGNNSWSVKLSPFLRISSSLSNSSCCTMHWGVPITPNTSADSIPTPLTIVVVWPAKSIPVASAQPTPATCSTGFSTKHASASQPPTSSTLSARHYREPMREVVSA